jgi:hypothetical protein
MSSISQTFGTDSWFHPTNESTNLVGHRQLSCFAKNLVKFRWLSNYCSLGIIECLSFLRDATGDNVIIINYLPASHAYVLYLHQLCFSVLTIMHFATLFLIRSVYDVISENIVQKFPQLFMCENARWISNELLWIMTNSAVLGFSSILISSISLSRN